MQKPKVCFDYHGLVVAVRSVSHYSLRIILSLSLVLVIWLYKRLLGTQNIPKLLEYVYSSLKLL